MKRLTTDRSWKKAQEENEKLKAENEKLTRENALFKLSMQSYQTSACSLGNLSTLTFQSTSNIINPLIARKI